MGTGGPPSWNRSCRMSCVTQRCIYLARCGLGSVAAHKFIFCVLFIAPVIDDIADCITNVYEKDGLVLKHATCVS